MDHVSKIARLAHAAQCALVELQQALTEAADAPVGEPLALDLMALRDALKPAIAVLAERAPKVERTPETVLRAMLRAYEAAALDAAVAHYKNAGSVESAIEAEERAAQVRDWLAMLCSGRPIPGGWAEWIRTDYEQRLAGTRPLDAPPLEAP